MTSVRGEIVLDVGTGDGLFVYRSARANAQSLFIGIDSNAKPLEKISEKIYRKPAKGGASNAMFVLAQAEELPEELKGIANSVHIHFPWGSLLQGVVLGDEKLLKSLKMVCAPEACLQIVAGIHLEKDQSEIRRLGLPEFTQEYYEKTLCPRYREAGFELTENRILSNAEVASLQSSWARRLRNSTGRSVHRISARAKAGFLS